MNRIGILTTCLIFAGITVGDTPGHDIKPVMVLAGSDSAIDKESFHRCMSQDEIRELWKKHRGVDDLNATMFCPKVDFDSHMVVAIFRGHGAIFGLRVDSITDEPKGIRIRYLPATVQLAGGKPRNLPRDDKGYAIVVLKRSSKAIVLEEGKLFDLTQPIEWSEHGKIPAIKADPGQGAAVDR